MSERTLTTAHLNRALLARQLLLGRSSLSPRDAIEQIGGLQTQYAPSGYVGLWTRLAGFERSALTAALEDRRIIQATLLRVTIHMVFGTTAERDFVVKEFGAVEGAKQTLERLGEFLAQLRAPTQ